MQTIKLWILLFSTFFLSQMVLAKDKKETITISIAELPVLAINNEEGILVDYVKGLGKMVEGVEIKLTVVPYQRSLEYLKQGISDFHFPILEPEFKKKNDFEYMHEKVFNVGFVLYTHKDSKVTLENVEGHNIETVAANLNLLGIKNIKPTTCPECSLRKVANKRLEGFIFAGLEMDNLINEQLQDLKPLLKSQMYKVYPVTFMLNKKRTSQKKIDKLNELVRLSYKSGLHKIYLGAINEYYRNWKPMP